MGGATGRSLYYTCETVCTCRTCFRHKRPKVVNFNCSSWYTAHVLFRSGVKLNQNTKGLIGHHCSWLRKSKKGGYLQNFEILETLESTAWNVPQLVSRDSPRKETQGPKVRENKRIIQIYDKLRVSFQHTRLMCFIKDFVLPAPFFVGAI